MSDENEQTVVLVGHCGPDMFMLRSAVSRVLKGARIVNANDDATLDEYRNSHSLWLVNRVLDGQFATQDGLDLIEGNATRSDSPVALLVSDLEEAQEESLKRGARPGFGKGALYDEQTAVRLRDAATHLASSAAR